VGGNWPGGGKSYLPYGKWERVVTEAKKQKSVTTKPDRTRGSKKKGGKFFGQETSLGENKWKEDRDKRAQAGKPNDFRSETENTFKDVFGEKETRHVYDK